MEEHKHRWSFWLGLALVNVAVIALYLWGRGGRRDHFVVTLQNEKLSLSVNGGAFCSDADVSAIPVERRTGIRFLLRPTEENGLPTRLRSGIQNVRVYAPAGQRPLFVQALSKLDDAAWSSERPGVWTMAPGRGLSSAVGNVAITLRPRAVKLDSFRLEFDLVNGLHLIFCPVYVDEANKVQAGFNVYHDRRLDVSRVVAGQGQRIADATATSRYSHILRAIAFELVDSYPYLIGAVVVLLAVQALLLAPLSALLARRLPRLPAWITALGVLALLGAVSGCLVWKGFVSLLGVLGNWSWAFALFSMLAAPSALFALTRFRRARTRPTGLLADGREQSAELEPTQSLPKPTRLRRWLWAVLVAVSVAAGTALILYATCEISEGMVHDQDAAAQLFQARMLAGGAFSVPITDAVVQGHFHFDWMLLRDGRWFSQFPPGHSLVLSLGVLAGAPWLVTALESGLTLLLVYLLGVRLAGRTEGLVAVWLMVFSPFFAMIGGSFMNNITATLFWSAGLLFFVQAVRARSFWGFFGCGVFMGMVFITRPLSAAALGGPLIVTAVVWVLLADRFRRFTALCGGMAGALLPVLFFLWFNYGTTGHPLVTGHAAMGVARYGLSGWGETLSWVLDVTLFYVWIFKRTLFDWPAFLTFAPIFALFISGRARRWDWLLLATCFSQAIAYSFYPYFTPGFGARYWYEMMPQVCLLAARGVAELAGLGRRYAARMPRSPEQVRYLRCGWYAPIGVVLVGFSAFSVKDFWLGRGPNRARVQTYVASSLGDLRGWRGVTRRLLHTVEAAGVHNAVVFVQVAGTQDYMKVFPHNSPFFRTDVIYARTLGSRADGRMMQSFPGRKAYFAARGADGWQVVPYPDNVPVPSHELGLQAANQRRPQIEPTRGRPEELARQVASAYPGWELFAAAHGLPVRLRRIGEQDNVIVLHPVSKNSPAVLRWEGVLSSGQAHSLSFQVARPPERGAAETLVQAWVNKRFLGERLADTDAQKRWIPCRCSPTPMRRSDGFPVATICRRTPGTLCRSKCGWSPRAGTMSWRAYPS